MKNVERQMMRSILAGVMTKLDVVRKRANPPLEADVRTLVHAAYGLWQVLHHTTILVEELTHRVEALEGAHAHQMGVIEDLAATVEIRT